MLTCIPPAISYLHNDVVGIAQRETKIWTIFKFTRILHNSKNPLCHKYDTIIWNLRAYVFHGASAGQGQRANSLGPEKFAKYFHHPYVLQITLNNFLANHHYKLFQKI